MGFPTENIKTRSNIFLNLINCTECDEAVVYFLKLSFCRRSCLQHNEGTYGETLNNEYIGRIYQMSS